MNNLVILMLTAIGADAICNSKVQDLPYIAFCIPHDQQGCESHSEWCQWSEASSFSYQPMAAGACVLKPEWDSAFSVYCTGTSETECMAGAGYAYCDWQSSGSGNAAPVPPVPPSTAAPVATAAPTKPPTVAPAPPAPVPPSTSEGCILKPEFDSAFSIYCQGSSEAECMAGAGHAYCNWGGSSGSGSSGSGNIPVTPSPATQAPIPPAVVPPTAGVPNPTPITTSKPKPPAQSDDQVIQGVIDRLYSVDYTSVLDSNGVPSTLYKAEDLVSAVHKAMEAGVGNLKLFDFSDIAGASLEQKIDYSMTNIAAFLAQAMHETIRYDACDENNWDNAYPDALYRASAACGQLEQDYQAYHCSDDGTGINYECEVDPNMELMGTTHAMWYGAPPPMFCAPKSKLATAPLWSTYGDSCWGVTPTVPESVDEIISLLNSDNGCWGYEGMKGGRYSVVSEELAANNSTGRSDLEGCCWWGRGVIQTTGICNFGKLNYHLGARAKREGRDALYGDIDFCRDPGAICNDPDYEDLKWFAGIFYYISDVQPWDTAEFQYKQDLVEFVDSGLANPNAFIDNVSGIVNRGCPKANCGSGNLSGKLDREANFETVLTAFKLK